jgi:sterol desaturase/sphingolipid hydroxylase (fatty acid hydroxylase superfamily)
MFDLSIICIFDSLRILIMEVILGLFGADPSSLPYDLGKLKDGTPPIIVYAVPFMLFFTILEIIVSYFQHRHYYSKDETIGSIGVGVGNLLVSAIINLALILFVVWVWKLVPWRMELNWWTFIPAYIIYDFCSYWAHRISHEQRFWWATHVAHHSGEYYNLAVSFRLSWVQHLKILFFLPTILCGFHPFVFFVTNQVAVLFQFWVHTEYIRKIHPVVEYIFATPSNHRVHHGSQEKYLDKNYGATFIIWDRMFGTYQPEEEQVIYGLTTNIEHKANPFYINFHEYKDMWLDVKNATSWKKKWFYIFGSPTQIMLEKKALQEQEASVIK